ncbi:MAG: 2,5-diamino-6-(ribosylamino)-4(3H)-pyrimidinone 5'-phosphate reductase [Candidatus Hodarchaeota archaeon]
MISEIPKNRPYVILNSAMSLCGRIASKTGDSRLSSQEDWVRVHELRANVDAIMVGLNTILKDDSKLTIKQEFVNGNENKPHRVVVDSLARTPPTARVLRVSPETPTTIAITSRAPGERIEVLKKAGANIKICGDTPRVNLKYLMEYLKKEKNVSTLLLEGGGTLNWAMLKEKLIDEIIVAIAPIIVGNGHSISLFEGEGFEKMSDSPLLLLKNYQEIGDCFLLTYQVQYQNTRYS